MKRNFCIPCQYVHWDEEINLCIDFAFCFIVPLELYKLKGLYTGISQIWDTKDFFLFFPIFTNCLEDELLIYGFCMNGSTFFLLVIISAGF